MTPKSQGPAPREEDRAEIAARTEARNPQSQFPLPSSSPPLISSSSYYNMGGSTFFPVIPIWSAASSLRAFSSRSVRLKASRNSRSGSRSLSALTMQADSICPKISHIMSVATWNECYWMEPTCLMTARRTMHRPQSKTIVLRSSYWKVWTMCPKKTLRRLRISPSPSLSLPASSSRTTRRKLP